ncbi:MAG: sigma 54-interacting transcriptional regulator [Hyphomicrobiaceae bacterium]|nr:sigma 54-interacting transcriptional regulator [Hyphomicrobiaceae bacterium]
MIDAPATDRMLVLLEAIVSYIDEGVVLAGLDGTILYQNPSAGELLGAPGNRPLSSLEDVFGTEAGESADGLVCAPQRTRRGATAAAGPESPDFARFVKRRLVGGEMRYLEFNSCRTCESMGGMRLVIMRDVTHLQRLEMLIDQSKGDLVTNDRKLLAILERVGQVASSNATVLLQGESGTGKTHIARLLHRMSRRSSRRFVEVNCAAIPDQLIESELFGHVKGAFTGALKDRPGRFQAADGGTLFLDEIAEVPMSLQAKLLRVIQDQHFEPVGSDATVRTDVRIITASNKDLRAAVDAGKFRADLYFRIAVFTLDVPALRERPGDIPLLVRYFVEALEGRGYPSDITFTAEAMKMMMNYPWPGNVRELENAVEHCLICAVSRKVQAESLPESIRRFALTGRVWRPGQQPSPGERPSVGLVRSDAGASSEPADGDSQLREEIVDALVRAKGNRSLAASYLGIDRTTLWRRMQKLRVE